MDFVLGDLIGMICLVYIDDSIVFSRNRRQHKRHAQQVLDRLHEAGFTLKLKKCEFGKNEVQLLGYTVSDKGIYSQEQKVEVM